MGFKRLLDQRSHRQSCYLTPTISTAVHLPPAKMMLKELMLLSCGVLSVLGATIPAKDRINIPLTDDQLIFPDNADDCINRPKQWQRARHSYFLSTNRTMNWMQARNYCRKSCMDAISIETAEENAWVTDLINSTGLNFIWTSGVCRGERCYNTNKETTHDWMWAGSGAQMAPSAECPAGRGACTDTATSRSRTTPRRA